MIKVAFVTTASLDSPYGIGRCYPLAKYLARLGCQVHIVALHHNWTSVTHPYQMQENVHIHHVGQMHVRKVGDDTLYFPPPKLAWIAAQGLLALTRALLAIQPDIIHIGKPHPQNSIAAFIAAHTSSGRTLLLDYDDYEAGINRFGHPLERRVIQFCEDRVPRHVHGVTTHSSFLKERLIYLGLRPDRIMRLPSGFDPERFQRRSHEDVLALESRLGIRGRRVALYVGTISFNNHPIDLLLEAFARVAPVQSDVVLVLAGGGADLERARHLAEQLGVDSQCRFLGRVPPDRVPLLLQAAMFSVDPTRKSATEKARWPLKIVESLAAGIPVVTGDIGDRREMLDNGQAGILTTPDDVASLADGLLMAYTQESRIRTMGDAAKRLSERYNAELLAEQLMGFYHKFRADNR
ncbi:MAG: glycosyltransferase family 1 protein [Gammaproteobacteria bacterium]|nr:MAG: glycosyltransferase family 1 protein [Gammaproteobacteria bacterium]